MAFITLAGTLRDPTSELAVGDQIRFTHKSTTGETVEGAVSVLTIDPSGTYSKDLQYGLVLVEYKDVRTSQFKNIGVATVNGSNPATSIPELLNALVPVSSAELIEFQAILADAVTAKNESVIARNEAEAFAASIDLINDLSQAYVFDTVALMKASNIVFPAGKLLKTKGYHLSGDGGEATYLVEVGATTEPFGSPALFSGYAKIQINNGVLNAQQYGITGNNTGAPYSSSFIEFMNKTGSSEVTSAVFPNKEIIFDNSTPASFQSNCTYTGGRNTVIQPTVFTERVFLTQSKANFEIRKIKSYIDESVGGEENNIGGGYWRFESCTDYYTNQIEVSKSFAGGIKMILCSDFIMRNTRAKYNQFTGLELEGCSDYDIDGYNFSNNGKFSSNDTYKPLPSATTGTHGGRGWTAGANANNVDQKDSTVKNGKCLHNSEYGFRCFTANTKGIKNLTISNFLLEDNGHPAGTYGTVVLASDKGVDALINSDATGESDNITVRDFEVRRSLGYGTHISWDGFNHKMSGYLFKSTGAGLHVLTPIALFGAKNFNMSNGESQGSNNHISFGSNNPSDIDIINDTAKDCLNYVNSNSSGGFNSMQNVKAFHRTTVAAVGEDGFKADGSVKWVMDNVLFDKFHQGLVVGNSATDLQMNLVRTTNTVTNGLRDFGSGGAGIVYNNCQFDSANPITRGSQVGGAGNNSQWASGISWSSVIITAGYYKVGHIVWAIVPGVVDGTHGRFFAGWFRLTTGTGHTLNTDWREIWVHSDSTTA